MAHEVFQSCVIGIRQVVDSFVEPDVPQTIILDFCSTRPVTRTVITSQKREKYSLAASKKPWCSCIVRSGSGSSLSQSLRTLVTLLMSLDHSSASRFVASKSVGRMSVSIPTCKSHEDRSRAFIEFFFQPSDFTHRPTDPIDAHCGDAVLLNRLTAFDHDGWHLHAVADHLFCEVDAKCGLDPIG